MSTKLIFTGRLKVILWLTLPSFLLAQAPERTKPALAVTERSQPCWEQVMKTMAEGANCFDVFIEELTKQKDNPATLEELELAGVRFLKANGYSDEAAARMVANQIKELSSATETSVPTKPETTEVVKPTPAVSEETPKEEEIHELRKQVADLQKLGARDKMISLRAAQIDLENQIKKEQKRLQKNKDEDPSARKARKELENREKKERAEQRRFQDAKNNADISCLDPESVVVIRSTGHLLYNRFQAFNRVTVENPQPYTVQISAVDPNKNHSGAIVDLPSGCSITLSRSIRPFIETSTGGSVYYWYTAKAINKSEYKGIARSQSYWLYSGNSFQQMTPHSWVIGNFSTN